MSPQAGKLTRLQLGSSLAASMSGMFLRSGPLSGGVLASVLSPPGPVAAAATIDADGGGG